jgi:predicted nucleic-acid-binding Zn-ribbon protein
MTCAKCGSEKIIPNAQVRDRFGRGVADDLEIEVKGDPKALLFTEAYRATAYARICAGCGHIELYTDHTQGLWEAYQDSLKRRQ